MIENYSGAQPLDRAGIKPRRGAEARQQTVDGELHFLFARDISGYGDLPITIGTYFLARAVDAPLRLFYWASIIALVMLGASLIAAALLARTISGPIRWAARGAAAIGTLDFDRLWSTAAFAKSTTWRIRSTQCSTACGLSAATFRVRW